MDDLVTLAVALLSIMNPIGAMAIFSGMTEGMSIAQRSATARTAAFAILVILVVVAWCGEWLLHLFGVSIPAFETAGGIIIASMGLAMLHGRTSAIHHARAGEAGGGAADGKARDNADEAGAERGAARAARTATAGDSIGVVPLAMPMIAGPGAITTVIVAAHKAQSVEGRVGITLVCVVVAAVAWIALASATTIGRRLGPQAVGITARIMGIVLTAIAMGMIATGVKGLLPGLAG